MTMQRTMKLYRLPEASGALGWWAGGKREAEESLTLSGKGARLWVGGGRQKVTHPIVSRSLDFPFLLFLLSTVRVLF